MLWEKVEEELDEEFSAKGLLLEAMPHESRRALDTMFRIVEKRLRERERGKFS